MSWHILWGLQSSEHTEKISCEHCCVDFYWITWHYKNYTEFLSPSSLGNVSGTIKLNSNNSSSSFIFLLLSLQKPLLSAIINGEFLVYHKCYNLPIWSTLPVCLNSMFEQEFNAVERGEIKDIWPAQYPVPWVNGVTVVKYYTVVTRPVRYYCQAQVQVPGQVKK